MEKVKYGLKNVHLSVINEEVSPEGVITYKYGTPKLIPGAVNMVLAPSGEAAEFFADDEDYFSEDTNNGYDGTLEIAILPDWVREQILGEVKDTDKSLLEVKEPIMSPFALLFEFSMDKTERKIRHIFYYCKPKRVNVEGSTRNKSTEPKTDTLTFAARPMPTTGIVKKKTTKETTEEAYNNWYKAVSAANIGG